MVKNFTLPTTKKLADIGRDLKLNDAQARELELVIRHAHADLEGYFRTRVGRASRKVRMDRLRAVDQAIGKLIILLGRNPERINDDLPFEARDAIVQCASSELITVVTEEVVSNRGARVLHKEQSAGFRHGASILLEQLRLIRHPIRNVLSEKSADPGGPEANHVQVVLIRALANAAPDIIGRRATATVRGKFEKLVGALFDALDIETPDLRKTIERNLHKKPPTRKTRT
ncbi:MAG: hypothetical protein WCJ41_13295 [Aestuariivirga sp.]|uniref:hypothetical protein n=1 Tax=Aestuariivirga sp. TaxID=2650926 RepID=UPI0030196EFB